MTRVNPARTNGVRLSDDVYARLLALRTGLRRFERWSEDQAKAAGMTPAQHQLLLAVRGHGDRRGPTIGEAADYLLLRHHSVVGLVDRTEAAGLLRRARDPDDHRVVRLQLTEDGARRLEGLSAMHLEELQRLQLDLPRAWQDLPDQGQTHGGAAAHRSARPRVTIARVYAPPPEPGGALVERVLVDRLWPRGVSRADAPWDTWLPDVAPSGGLRTWYGHVAERFDEFARRYREELRVPPASVALEGLRASASGGGAVVLLTATRDLEHSGAAVLRDVLVGRSLA